MVFFNIFCIIISDDLVYYTAILIWVVSQRSSFIVIKIMVFIIVPIKITAIIVGVIIITIIIIIIILISITVIVVFMIAIFIIVISSSSSSKPLFRQACGSYYVQDKS